jgi:hypothetical protein
LRRLVQRSFPFGCAQGQDDNPGRDDNSVDELERGGQAR